MFQSSIATPSSPSLKVALPFDLPFESQEALGGGDTVGPVARAPLRDARIGAIVHVAFKGLSDYAYPRPAVFSGKAVELPCQFLRKSDGYEPAHVISPMRP